MYYIIINRNKAHAKVYVNVISGLFSNALSA